MKVFTQRITPRIRYAIQLVFADTLGAKGVSLVDDWESFSAYDGPRLIYGREKLEGVPSLYNVDLLLENDIAEQEITVQKSDSGIPYFFSTSGQSLLPFDVLASAFYLATRYEEYLPHISDNHDRFPAEESLAFQNNFLHIPVVNHWALQLKQQLLVSDSRWLFTERQFEFTSTVDVDNLYAYLGKGGFRTLGGIAKDLVQFDLKNLWKRLQCLTGRRKDPYDTFDLQRSLAEKYNVPMRYFMLFSEFGEFDRNIPMYSRRMHEAVRAIADFFPVGIHPSYGSHAGFSVLEKEVNGLAEALRTPVISSRQHFLKLKMPQTFRELVDLGVKDDYTMGYASHLGFRAGLCTSFTFYDLEMEVALPLTMHPFAMMDGTLIYYQSIGADEALEHLLPIVDEVKKVNGHLISIWHNRIFSESSPEWVGWNAVYEELLKKASR